MKLTSFQFFLCEFIEWFLILCEQVMTVVMLASPAGWIDLSLFGQEDLDISHELKNDHNLYLDPVPTYHEGSRVPASAQVYTFSVLVEAVEKLVIATTVELYFCFSLFFLFRS